MFCKLAKTFFFYFEEHRLNRFLTIFGVLTILYFGIFIFSIVWGHAQGVIMYLFIYMATRSQSLAPGLPNRLAAGRRGNGCGYQFGLRDGAYSAQKGARRSQRSRKGGCEGQGSKTIQHESTLKKYIRAAGGFYVFEAAHKYIHLYMICFNIE